jgi:DNA-binding SARP family transcriptional activator
MRPSRAAHGALTDPRVRLVFSRWSGYNPGVPDFRILGPLEVVGDDGVPIALGGTKQRALLAVLLLRAGEVVSSEALVLALWGEEAPRTATPSLQNSISQLRKLLGADLLQTKAPGYVLAVAPESIDLGRFERLVAAARALPAEEQVDALRKALDLWRGEPLADLLYEPFAGPEVHRLEELRLATLEDWGDAVLAAGGWVELTPELERLVRKHPLRERLHGQLMLALYHSGRQADALNAYQSARRTLVDELGLDPSPRLQELHARILRQEVPRPRLAAEPGEEDHYREVADALLAGRLVPVIGTDVTALAARLAERFEYPPDEGADLTRVAQYVALTKGGGPLYDELRAMLEVSPAPTATHRFFAGLPPLLRERGVPHQLLVTTGYDLALEQALLDAGEEFDVVSYIAAGRHRGRFCHVAPDGHANVVDVPNTYLSELSLDRRTVILKLHGGLDRSAARSFESFVVTEDDYIDYLSQTDVGAAIPVALAAKLRRSHFLFLGYGMRDWNLRLVLGRVWGGEGVNYRSWAVLPSARPLERQLWRTRDVDLLELALDDYVEALGRYIGVTAGASA